MNNKTYLPLVAFVALLLLSATSVSAQDAQRKDYLTFYTGTFDVLDDDNAAQFGMEYRAQPLAYNIVPIIGVNVTTDSAVYGYAGLNWDWYFSEGVVLTPNFAAGLYKDGDGKDLGGTIEFRSGIELAYIFNDNSRAGIAFNHISNASIYDRNPGAETLLVNYSVPIANFMP